MADFGSITDALKLWQLKIADSSLSVEVIIFGNLSDILAQV